MANFFGGIGNDVANAAIGELTGFTGSVAELTDNIGDLFSGANGDDFVFAGNADDKIQGGEGHDALNGGGGDDVIFADTELSIASLIGDEIVGNLGNDRLYGANGDDVMEGGEGHDTLQGFGGNDLMRGGTGHDKMNGGAGVDAFDAGGGDDTLIFAPGDVLAGEIIDGGADFDRILVNGAVWFTDAASIAGIEMVELAGGVSVAILTASQVRTGLPANLLLDAANFQGTIETFRVEMGGETVLDVSGLTFGAFWEFSDRVDLVGDDDDEVIAGSARFDRIFGNYGNDTLIGNGGVDHLAGGPGNDVYLVDQQGGEVVEDDGDGNDTVLAFSHYFLPANVENLTLLGTAPVNGTGNSLANMIVGNNGSNFLDGDAGVDTLQGGLGDDTYLVDKAGDAVIETAGAGNDTVQASVNYKLAGGVQVETLTTTNAPGTVAISLTGNTLKQTITGNAGANVLHDGGVGASDTLRGLGGNDTYRVFNAGDVVIESSTQGAEDRVMAAVDYTLGKGVFIELFTTNGSTGTSAIDLTGNEISQEILGNDGDNRLEGKGGSDTLRGFDGKDSFVFASTIGAANIDTILDFVVVDDRFLLSDAIFTALDTGTLSAAAFRSNTTGLAEDASDRIIYETDTGEVYYDADGTGGGAAGIEFATIDTGLALTNSDFSVA